MNLLMLKKITVLGNFKICGLAFIGDITSMDYAIVYRYICNLTDCFNTNILCIEHIREEKK